LVLSRRTARSLAGQQRLAQGGSLTPARKKTIPAPTRGLNKRDNEASLNPQDALELVNWNPGTGSVKLRRGYGSAVSTGVGSSDVEYIGSYISGATKTLIAAGGGRIYNCTTPGAAVELASGFSANDWQDELFNDKLVLVNGADAPQEFDGSSISALTVSGTGLTVAHLVGVQNFKSRNYYWEKEGGTNARSFWYTAVNAHAGNLTKFVLPMQRGYLHSMVTWSQDGGAGPDDLMAFITSEGGVLIYQGSNPGDASDWAIVGNYTMPIPITIRGTIKQGGEAIVMTKGGYLPLSAVLRGARESDAISDRIASLVADDANNYFDNVGWQVVQHPTGTRLIFNVPVSTTQFVQHVMNTLTGAWSTYGSSSIAARTWGVHDGGLYIGDLSGNIYKFDSAAHDNGSVVQGTARQAPSYFGRPGSIKQVTALKPTMKTSAGVSISIGAEADFNEVSLAANLYTINPEGEPWENVSPAWEDWDDIWGGTSDAVSKWYSAPAIGDAIGVKLLAETATESIEWLSTTFAIKGGIGI
jgi:hypothetical protein